MLAITIATNTTDRTNHSGQAQINNRSTQNPPGTRKPNDEYEGIIPVAHIQDPQLLQQLVRPSCNIVSASFTQRPNTEAETPEHKTLNNALVTTNEVLSITWKLSVSHTPHIHNTKITQDSRIILAMGLKTGKSTHQKDTWNIELGI